MLAFVILIMAGVSYYFDLQDRIRELVHPPAESTHPFIAEKPIFPPSAPLRKVRLFFPSVIKDGLLEVEEREIHSSENVSIEAKEIVAELIKGSREGRGMAIPAQAKLREVFVEGEGLVFVDLTREIADAHPGGLTQEVSTIYAIVDSLTGNVPSIRRVQILIEGSEAETLAGHVGLGQPFGRDLSMTNLPEDLELSHAN
jgi:hypothetical protein